MTHKNYAFDSYGDHYHYGDIVIMHSDDLSKGVLIELKGKGCRKFESFLLAQHSSWYDFFIDCIKYQAVFKRVDLAINDKVGILDIPELAKNATTKNASQYFVILRIIEVVNLPTDMRNQTWVTLCILVR